MSKVNIYQIGVGDFGRWGFEKLIEMEKHLENPEVELKGVCERDFEKLDDANKFAEANDIEIEKFHHVEKMYEQAAQEDGKVMIYDAGPAHTHSKNVYRSMQHGFFHLAEKPPSMTRGQHIKEKRLAEQNDAMWKTDFIERENPVVQKAIEVLDGKNIDRIEVFRESSTGIQKLLDPVKRRGIKGGDILDLMTNEVFVLDLLEAANQDINWKLKEANTNYFLPKELGSEKMLSIHGGYTEEINYDTANAQTQAKLDTEEAEIKLHSSWLGLSREAQVKAKNLKEEIGHKVFSREYSENNDKAFINEETRFFTVEGEKNLVGDLQHERLFDLDSKEEIELDYRIHDQLYRVIEKAVRKAAGEDIETITEKEIDIFMNAIFDIKEEVVEGDLWEELEKVEDKIDSMIVSDKKVLENKGTDLIAG